MLHDPHNISEPVLVISGLTYLLPFYIAINKKRRFDAFSFLFLTCTTVGFHGTRNEMIFIADCLAILIFLARTYYVSLHCTMKSRIIFYLSVVYSFTSYFVGMYLRIMSFHPNWNTQMFYHSLMHLSTAFSIN